MGFEPMTPASRTLCASQTALRPDARLHYRSYWISSKEIKSNVQLDDVFVLQHIVPVDFLSFVFILVPYPGEL